MSLNIDMKTAVTGRGGGQDLTTVLNSIQGIATGQASQDKIFNYLECLSQTMSMEGIYRGTCESMLKAKLFSLAREYRSETQTAIQDRSFKYDSHLSDTIKKLDYLSAGIFGFYNGFTNYTARVCHHLNATYFNNTNLEASYLTAGASFLLSAGLLILYSDDPAASPDNLKVTTGWGCVGLGATLMATPFINCFVLAAQEEP